MSPTTRPPSEALRRFTASLSAPFRSRQQLDAFDLDALSAITPDERDAARHAIVDHIRRAGDDPRVVEALAILGDDASWREIEALAQGPCSITAVTAAHALWRQRRETAVAGHLARCARDPDPRVRAVAIETLGRVDGAPAAAEFTEALHDPVPEVRSAALRGLMSRYGLDQLDNRIGSEIYRLSLGVTSGFEALREDAADALGAIIAGLEAGATVAELGLSPGSEEVSPAIEALWDAVDDPARPLDRRLVEDLTAAERGYAVEYLSRSLERGDTRVVPLLEAIGTPRARLALDAAAGRA